MSASLNAPKGLGSLVSGEEILLVMDVFTKVQGQRLTSNAFHRVNRSLSVIPRGDGEILIPSKLLAPYEASTSLRIDFRGVEMH